MPPLSVLVCVHPSGALRDWSSAYIKHDPTWAEYVCGTALDVWTRLLIEDTVSVQISSPDPVPRCYTSVEITKQRVSFEMFADG